MQAVSEYLGIVGEAVTGSHIPSTMSQPSKYFLTRVQCDDNRMRVARLEDGLDVVQCIEGR